MATLFDDAPRPQSHQGIHASPIASPRVVRPASQASLHLPPAYSTFHGEPISAHPQSVYRPYQPTGLSLPLPTPGYPGSYPSTAPPMSFYPTSTPIYDSRGAHHMIRTISHAHPMNSATEHTVSSRYSSSPHSAAGHLEGPPPTAGAQPYIFHGMAPGFPMHESDERHINPAIFNNSYPMSRSTSGATDPSASSAGRLLTPHYEYRQHLDPDEAELRKVSDSLGRATGGRFLQQTFTPSFGGLQDHALSLAPHPQPEGMFYGNYRSFATDNFALSAERGDTKPELPGMMDTQYERERQQQIMQNKKIFEDIGLSDGSTYARSHNTNSVADRNRQSSTPRRRQVSMEAPSRISSRIASLHRNVSYANLDGQPRSNSDEDEYIADPEMDEEDFRPVKRTKGQKMAYGRKSQKHKPELSLYGLLEGYPDIPHLFPLFYYTLNNDLTINNDSVPLIGSIPSTITPLEKSETLQNFFHRGRRVLAQVDSFTARCDRKYEGPEERWIELEYFTRIAIRDVRRKVVERCENYKYTRRDILDKMVGKNKWQPIERGLIDWHAGMAENDPAGDLANVTLTLPTPPPGVHSFHTTQGAYPNRTIRPFPSRSQRIVTTSLALNSGGGTPHTASYPNSGISIMSQAYAYPTQPAPPMYGEDEVPMTVQMPMVPRDAAVSGAMAMPGSATALAPPPLRWEMNESRGLKRSRSESPESEEGDSEAREDDDEDEDAAFGEQKQSLWAN